MNWTSFDESDQDRMRSRRAELRRHADMPSMPSTSKLAAAGIAVTIINVALLLGVIAAVLAMVKCFFF